MRSVMRPYCAPATRSDLKLAPRRSPAPACGRPPGSSSSSAEAACQRARRPGAVDPLAAVRRARSALLFAVVSDAHGRRPYAAPRSPRGRRRTARRAPAGPAQLPLRGAGERSQLHAGRQRLDRRRGHERVALPRRHERELGPQSLDTPAARRRRSAAWRRAPRRRAGRGGSADGRRGARPAAARGGARPRRASGSSAHGPTDTHTPTSTRPSRHGVPGRGRSRLLEHELSPRQPAAQQPECARHDGGGRQRTGGEPQPLDLLGVQRLEPGRAPGAPPRRYSARARGAGGRPR